MPKNSRSLRAVGIAAGVLGSVQAVAWCVLSILGILVYIRDINGRSFDIESDPFLYVLLFTYFDRSGRSWEDVINLSIYLTRTNIMTPGAVVVWTSLYFATSVIWLVISVLLLYDFCRSKFTSKIITVWVAVSAVIAAIDLAGTVAFGMEYDKLQTEIGKGTSPVLFKTELLLAPIFMMLMCARGFILWIINIGFVIYLGAAASRLSK